MKNFQRAYDNIALMNFAKLTVKMIIKFVTSIDTFLTPHQRIATENKQKYIQTVFWLEDFSLIYRVDHISLDASS